MERQLNTSISAYCIFHILVRQNIFSPTIITKISNIFNLSTNSFDGREYGKNNMQKWKYLIDAPFKISNNCCNVMKKHPAHKFDKSSGLKPIIGTMACESTLRKSQWLLTVLLTIG